MKLQLTAFLTIALSTVTFAQEKTKELNFEVQTIQIVNGKETRFDTSFSTNNLVDLAEINALVNKRIAVDSLTKPNAKIVVLDDKTIEGTILPIFEINTINTTEGQKKLMTIKLSNDATSQMMQGLEPQWQTAGNMQDTMMGKTIIIKNLGKCNATKEEIENAKVEYEVTITSKVMVCDFNLGERKNYDNKVIPASDNLTFTENINCSPNPSNGKFNLSFELKNTNPVSIDILSPAGEVLYHESLANFSGKYSKEINTASLAKGVYALRIRQGSNSTVKKLVIE